MKVRHSDISSLINSFDRTLGFEEIYKVDLIDLVLYFNKNNEIEAAYIKKQEKEEIHLKAFEDIWYYYCAPIQK